MMDLRLLFYVGFKVIIGNGKNEQRKNGSFAWLDQEAGNEDSLNGRFMIPLSKVGTWLYLLQTQPFP